MKTWLTVCSLQIRSPVKIIKAQAALWKTDIIPDCSLDHFLLTDCFRNIVLPLLVWTTLTILLPVGDIINVAFVDCAIWQPPTMHKLKQTEENIEKDICFYWFKKKTNPNKSQPVFAVKKHCCIFQHLLDDFRGMEDQRCVHLSTNKSMIKIMHLF